MRVFILGAGFSIPAGLPSTLKLTEDVLARLRASIGDDYEALPWAEEARSLLSWLRENEASIPPNDPLLADRSLNIEALFYYAEAHQDSLFADQHECPVGRSYGDTPYSAGEGVDSYLSAMEDALLDLLLDFESNAALDPIVRFAKRLRPEDTVVTFNYDLLLERALDSMRTSYNLGFDANPPAASVKLLKAHGSLDWARTPRNSPWRSPAASLLFRKADANLDRATVIRGDEPTGESEYDHELWRVAEPTVLRKLIQGRDLTPWYWPGLAGLGHRKRISVLPGLGRVWRRAADAVFSAEEIIIIGFSFSDFDRFATLKFGAACHERHRRGHKPPRVLIVAPDASSRLRVYRRVFPTVKPLDGCYERVDWEGALASL